MSIYNKPQLKLNMKKSTSNASSLSGRVEKTEVSKNPVGKSEETAPEITPKRSNGTSALSAYVSLGCAILILCGTYAWGKNAKGTPIYINQHGDHACENFMGDIKGKLLQLKNVDKNVVKGLDLSKGCLIMDVARHLFPEQVAKFQNHVKSHYTHSGGWFGSSLDHGETKFANTALVHTLVESILPLGTFMMGVGSWLVIVNVLTGIKTFGIDFLGCGTFMTCMALMCGTTEGLTIEGMCITFLIAVAVYLDSKTTFFSYQQLLLYSTSMTIALYHSNNA